MAAEERGRWASRTAFVFAAIGSAAGLGNAWRFPYMAYANGGGAFLIPYFFALITAGIPLLILEYGIGQRLQRGAPGALRLVKRPFEFIGWWALMVGFTIVAYYVVVMGWIVLYMGYSLSLAWAGREADFFQQQVLQVSEQPRALEGICWPIFLGLVVSWVLIYLCIYKGVRGVSKVVMITVPLPVVLLAVLAVRGLTLPGAVEGLNYYLEPDFSRLLDPQVWLAAYGQIFFTLSLGFGIMIAYASYEDPRSDVNNNAFLTAFSNCGISFLAGFAVFSVLGFMAQTQGLPIEKVVASGPSLAFVTYPKGIALLPGGTVVQALFGLIFFLMLFTLGIDSAFSIVEAINVGVEDKWKLTRTHLVILVCSLGFLGGILFTTRAGLYWLDIVDHYATHFGLTVIGLLECLLIGWVYGAERLRQYLNEVSDISVGLWWSVCVQILTPAVLFVILTLQLRKEFQEPYGDYPAWALISGASLVVLAPLIGWLLASARGKEA
ncbi:MAG TPA: sodium-dependent transporter [Armatimonadetes bacterium]|nr:sodium-dependent transporter [Armatimonadota bacterium]